MNVGPRYPLSSILDRAFRGQLEGRIVIRPVGSRFAVGAVRKTLLRSCIFPLGRFPNRPYSLSDGRVGPDGPIPVGIVAAVGHHELQFIHARQVHIHILDRRLQRHEPAAPG